MAGQVRGRERQEAAQAVVEDQPGVLAVHPDAAPAVDLVPQVPGAGQLDQAALVRAPPQRQQRRLWAGGVGEEQGQATPGLGGVDQPGVVGGPAFAPAAGLAVALYVEVDAGRPFDVGEGAQGVDGVEQSGLVAGQLGRQAQLDGAAVTQTGPDQDPLGQQRWRPVEHGDAALGPGVQPGGVDHQRRGSVAAQELTPGHIDRFAGRAALGQPGLLHVLQPLQGAHLPGSAEAGQRVGQRRRRRHRTIEHGAAGVEPLRQHRQVGHDSPVLASGGSASSCRA